MLDRIMYGVGVAAGAAVLLLAAVCTVAAAVLPLVLIIHFL